MIVIVVAALSVRPGPEWRRYWKQNREALRQREQRGLPGAPVQPRVVTFDEIWATKVRRGSAYMPAPTIDHLGEVVGRMKTDPASPTFSSVAVPVDYADVPADSLVVEEASFNLGATAGHPPYDYYEEPPAYLAFTVAEEPPEEPFIPVTWADVHMTGELGSGNLGPSAIPEFDPETDSVAAFVQEVGKYIGIAAERTKSGLTATWALIVAGTAAAREKISAKIAEIKERNAERQEADVESVGSESDDGDSVDAELLETVVDEDHVVDVDSDAVGLTEVPEYEVRIIDIDDDDVESLGDEFVDSAVTADGFLAPPFPPLPNSLHAPAEEVDEEPEAGESGDQIGDWVGLLLADDEPTPRTDLRAHLPRLGANRIDSNL